MHILQLCARVDQRLGGAAASTLGSFKALIDYGLKCELFSFGENQSDFKTSGFLPGLESKYQSHIYLVHRRRASAYGHILKFREIKKLVSLFRRSDVVITHQVYGLQSIYTFILARTLKKPYIVMPHGSLTKYDQNHHKIRKIIFNLIFLKMYLKNAKRIFVASKIEAIEIAAGFPNTEVAVVGLGFPKQEAKALTHFEMNSQMPIFLFMGRITRKKRLDLTILAFAKFNSKFPGSKLIVAGDGALRDTRILRDLVDDLDLAHLIDFRGWLFGNDKINALNDSDFFILNSEDENFAVIVPEVQQLGIPALVSRAVAYSEVVSKYSSGVVIEDLTIESIVTGMEKLVGHKYSELALNALACSKSVEWRIVIDKWVAEIRSLSALETHS